MLRNLVSTKINIRLTDNKATVVGVLKNTQLQAVALTEDERLLINTDQYELNKEYSYLSIYSDEELIGILILRPLTTITVDCHWFLLPHTWGTGLSDSVVQELDRWLNVNTHYTKVCVQTPHSCKEVLEACARNGFKMEGLITKGICWNNRVEDMIILSRFIQGDN